MSQHRHRKHRHQPTGEGHDHPDQDHGQEQPDEQAAEQDQAGQQPAGDYQQAGPQDLQALQAERDDLLGRLQRVSADYMNYQKRVQRDVAAARDYANEELMKALLGVLDDMDRALEVASSHCGGDDPIVQGVRLVRDKAMETLGRFGLKQIEAEGQPFDPQRHAALMQEPSDQPPMTVLRELQRGYELKGRTLRAASVVVARAPDQQS